MFLVLLFFLGGFFQSLLSQHSYFEYFHQLNTIKHNISNQFYLLKETFNFISLNGSYLSSMLNSVIIFQTFRTILKISTSDVSFFLRLLSIFAIINNIALNFAKKTSFSNICTNVSIIRQNLRILVPKSTMVCLFYLAVRAQYYWFCH